MTATRILPMWAVLPTLLAACAGQVDASHAPGGAAAAAPEAGPRSSESSDASPPDSETEDAADAPSPLARCSGARDVFAFLIAGSGGAATEGAYTNLDATWSAQATPTLDVKVTPPNDVGGVSLAIDTVGSPFPGVGTFPQSVDLATPVRLLLNMGADAFQIRSGTLTIDSIDADAGDGPPGHVQSLLLDFDLVCAASDGDVVVRGCMRYAAE